MEWATQATPPRGASTASRSRTTRARAWLPGRMLPSMRLGPPGLHALKPVAPPVAVDLSGAELTRDGGVEATPPRPGLVPAGLIPNRPATPGTARLPRAVADACGLPVDPWATTPLLGRGASPQAPLWVMSRLRADLHGILSTRRALGQGPGSRHSARLTILAFLPYLASGRSRADR
jgi:hypothetical protein